MAGLLYGSGLRLMGMREVRDRVGTISSTRVACDAQIELIDVLLRNRHFAADAEGAAGNF